MNSSLIQEWLIKNYGPEVMNPGLERVVSVLENDLKQIKSLSPYIVTIAGTNGKGETALTLSHILKENNLNYVLWTSPHIISLTERFQSPKGEIENSILWDKIQILHAEISKSKIKLSYYEFLWVIFVRWAIEKKADVLILEVGLGGRLDAVNVLDADLVLLPSISRDHQDILGARFDLILKEKLGVMRDGGMIFSSLELQYLREKISKDAMKHQWIWKDYFLEKDQALENFSLRNRALSQWGADEILKIFQIIPKSVNLSLNLPGRGEVWSYRDISWTFYGSHNVDGVRKLIHLLETGPYNQMQDKWHQVWVAFSNRSEGDLTSMIKILQNCQWQKKVKFCSFDHPKAWNKKEIKLKDKSADKISIINWQDELSKSLLSKQQNILVLGSYYFVAEIQSYLNQHFIISKNSSEQR